ncbi:NDP-sugar synthase [bacterium]|nr:NDP-sugar synthase [bacterium]
MKAIILCAGLGTRLKPLSKGKPKPLFPVLGEPILGNIIRYLAHNGATEIAINLNHLGSQILEYIHSEDWGGITFRFFNEKKILGTGGALKNMKDFINEQDDIIIHNGDVVSNFDLADAVLKHQTSNAISTMLLTYYEPVNTVQVDENMNILGFGSKPNLRKKANKSLTFTGISVIKGRLVKYFPDEEFFPLTGPYRRIIADGSPKLQGYFAPKAYWIDIGTKKRYLQLHEDILLKGRYELVGREYLPDRYFVAENVKFGENITMKGFNAIGDNCIIEDDVSLEDCVLWNGSRIKKGTELKREVISGE